MKNVNLGTITAMQSRCKIWPLNVKSFPCRTNLLRKQKRVDESFSNRQTSRKSFTDTLGIVVHPRLTLSETNGIAERMVRRIKEGTSAVLLQSKLGEKWWADSMECYCYLRNVQDLLSDGKTPRERRFGEPFSGPVIPFGSMIEYHSISAEDQSKTPPVR